MQNSKNKTKKQKIKVVYRLDIAMQLQKMGHKLINTFPNPQKAKLVCFAFEVDKTFYEDLNRLIEETK